MLRAERMRDAGSYAESADLFARAYRARPEAERADLTGEITVKSALADYRLARAEEPENLTLLEAQADLMREFIDARARSLGKGEASLVVAQMEEELEELLEVIEQRSRESEEAALVENGEKQPEPEPEPEPRIDEGPLPAAAALRPSTSSTDDRPPARGTAADFAILGTGLAFVAGGMPFLIGGAVNFAQLEDKADARLAELDADPDYTEEEREAYREGELQEWRSQWRSRATGMVVGGALATAAGVGLVTWAAIRLRRKRPGRQDERLALRGISVRLGRASVVLAF
ncbi:MAG: hypothetical protein AAGF11_20140 [Myxococcota bacterium]